MIPFLLPILLQTVQTVPADSGEVHLRNIRQLTFGGQNAEAYFSRSGRQIILQRTEADSGCDQEFGMKVDVTGLHRVSSGNGRTTCGYFFADDRRIFYATTEHGGAACPPRPDYSKGYVWALYNYDIYVANADGSGARRITDNPGYDAEGTLSPDGKTIVFTSLRDGDLYLVNSDGSGLEQITTNPEFDAFPMFSPDGKQLVWASNRHGKVQGETNVFVADWIETP